MFCHTVQKCRSHTAFYNNLFNDTVLSFIQIRHQLKCSRHASNTVLHGRRCLYYRVHHECAKVSFKCLFEKELLCFLRLLLLYLTHLQFFVSLHYFALLLISLLSFFVLANLSLFVSCHQQLTLTVWCYSRYNPNVTSLYLDVRWWWRSKSVLSVGCIGYS